MERKLGQLVPYEYRDTISKVTIEPEKPYGIYLPDWKSVVKTLKTFATSEYQSTAPLPKEDIVYEYESRVRDNRPRKGFEEYSKEDLLNFINFYGEPALPTQLKRTLQKAKKHFEGGDTMPLDDGGDTRGAWQINNGENAFFLGGRTFYKTTVTIEALRSQKKDLEDPNEDNRSYREPYIVSIYSKLNTEDPEAILMQATGAEKAVLPRRVRVMVHPNGYTGIDTGELANRLNDTFHNDGKGRIDRLTLSASLIHADSRTLGIYDGFELKIHPYNVRHMGNPSQRHAGLEFTIADPALESRAYRVANLIPPEKRQAAQSLAEKLASAFRQ